MRNDEYHQFWWLMLYKILFVIQLEVIGDNSYTIATTTTVVVVVDFVALAQNHTMDNCHYSSNNNNNNITKWAAITRNIATSRM